MKTPDTPGRYTVLISDCRDPYWNLAVEEILLDRQPAAGPFLFLWQSTPTVVIGKNQNPWRECNSGWMAEHGVQLARRISGGGAVYHDAGNLNYAFLMPRERYDADAVFGIIGDVLSDMGLSAERMNRTSLAIDGFKFSGNAFCFRRKGALHHGTLLINAALDAVRESLEAPAWKIETRATASIPARVKNLSEWKPGLTLDAVRDLFVSRFGRGAACRNVEEIVSKSEVEACCARLLTDQWIYGKTPPFQASVPVTIGGRTEEIRVEVERGHVVAVQGTEPYPLPFPFHPRALKAPPP